MPRHTTPSAADRERSDLLHDLRTPLSGVIAAADLMLEEEPLDPVLTRRLLADIRDAALEVDEMVTSRLAPALARRMR